MLSRKALSPQSHSHKFWQLDVSSMESQWSYEFGNDARIPEAA